MVEKIFLRKQRVQPDEIIQIRKVSKTYFLNVLNIER